MNSPTPDLRPVVRLQQIAGLRKRRRLSVTRRQLDRGHFGFMRAIIQGINARGMWERYLAEEGELQRRGDRVNALVPLLELSAAPPWPSRRTGATAAR